MTLRRWHAVVFDLDDTLYLERDYVRSGFRAVAVWAEGKLGVEAEAGFETLWQLFKDGVRGITFNRWLASHTLESEELVDEMVAVYRAHTPGIKPLPGATSLLTRLQARCRLGLVSDGYLAVQQRKLSSLGLARHFEAIVFSDAWGREAWKPSVTPFRAVLSKLGDVEPARAVYVADNPAKDFVGPREIGMASIRLRHPAGLHSGVGPPSPAYAPDAEIESLLELEETLDALKQTGKACL